MKFTKKNLVDQLGFNEEDTAIVLEYQKRLTILAELEDIEGFCVDARALWEQLEHPQSLFLDWVRRRFLPYGFHKNIDFSVTQICTTENTEAVGMNQQVNYLLPV